MVGAGLSDNEDLPDLIPITPEEYELYYPLWLEWRASDKQHLPYPGGLVDQPTQVMTVLHVLDSVAEKVTKQLQKKV